MTARDVTGFCALFSARKSGDFLHILGRFPNQIAQKTRRHRKKIHWRKFKKIQWRRHPEIADFCPLSWSNASWKIGNAWSSKGQARILEEWVMRIEFWPPPPTLDFLSISKMARQKCNMNFSMWILVWSLGGEFLEGALFIGKHRTNKFDPRIQPQNSGLKNSHPRIRPQIRVHEVQNPSAETCPLTEAWLCKDVCLQPGLGWKFLLRRTWSGQKTAPTAISRTFTPLLRETWFP